MSLFINSAETAAPELDRFGFIKQVVFGRPVTILALAIIVIFTGTALFAPALAPYDPLAQSFLKINRSPSWENWLGTDQFGRDVLSRMIYGSATRSFSASSRQPWPRSSGRRSA